MNESRKKLVAGASVPEKIHPRLKPRLPKNEALFTLVADTFHPLVADTLVSEKEPI